MRKRTLFLSTAWLAMTLSPSQAAPALIPTPHSLETREGEFRLAEDTRIVTDARGRTAADYFAKQLRTATGWPLPVSIGQAAKGAIAFSVGPEVGPGREGYVVDVSDAEVSVTGADRAGALYGAVTLLQLLPEKAFSPVAVSNVEWRLPALKIVDEPRFKWRGVLLDVARHFFTVEEVERVMDLMAAHKMNRLQIHLVDDQGWRIEIRKHPRLTEAAAWRRGINFGLSPMAASAYGRDGRYGGFYTQEDIRRLVRYGADLNITIVPEVEMPGHASGALSAYPEFSCHGGPYSTDLGGGVYHGVYCAGQDETYAFLEDILDEVIQLFPSKYIHIGGDEVPKDNWKKCARCQQRIKDEGLKNEHDLQSYFVRRVQKIIEARDRVLVGWSEIREGGMAKNALLMDWIGGGLEAATEGHDVVMTPTAFCYLDYYQSTNTAEEPKGIGGFVPLSKVYELEPVPAGLPENLQHHILGAQGNLWTEYIANIKHVEYMLFPRLCALSEVTWSPPEARRFEDFMIRLEEHVKRLDERGVHYRPLGKP